MANKLIRLVILLASLAFADVNTWYKSTVVNNDSIYRFGGAMVYLPDSNRFLLSMGSFFGIPAAVRPYSEQVMGLSDTVWKNHFPQGKLGLWGDITGPSDSVTWTVYFAIERHNGIVRPSLDEYRAGLAYNQYAYDSDEGKVYYYIQNQTFCYDPNSRIWTVLAPSSHPSGSSYSKMHWGSLCYDPVNKEVLLFGGGCVDAPKGNVGTWTYKPSTNSWTKLNPLLEPSPRAYSPMVFDAKNQVIVLFSGDHGDSLLGDTWIYQCATRTWVRKHPAISPSPRGAHAMLYLPKSRKVVMFGGYTYPSSCPVGEESYLAEYSGLFNELWVYDLTAGAEGSWTLIKRFSSAEPNAYWRHTYASMAAVDTADRIVMIGSLPGSYYSFGGVTYVMQCDPSQTDLPGTTTYGWKTDSNKTRIAAWNMNYFRQDENTVDTGAQEAMIRALPLNVITPVSQPRYPLVGRSFGKAAISSDRGIIFYWGGGHAELSMNDMPEYHISRNRWYLGYNPDAGFDSRGMNEGGPPGTVSFSGHPFMVQHAGDAYEYCPILRKVLLRHRSNTFLYNPDIMEWDSIKIPEDPQMTSDVEHLSLNQSPHGMVAWEERNSVPALWILDTISLRWKLLPIKNSENVPGNYCTQTLSVYDGKRDRMLISTTRYVKPGQMWEYRFRDSTFNKLNPLDTGLVRTLWDLSGAYIASADQVLFPFAVSAGNVTGYAVYDCEENRWKCAPVTRAGGGALPVDQDGRPVPFMYDEKRDLIWATDYRNQIWAMKYQDQSVPYVQSERTELPDRFAGFNASPNPFTHNIRISSGSPSVSLGAVAIYDMRGQKMSANLIRDAKSSAITWAAGQAASGWYLIEAKTEKGTVNRKVLLMR